MEMFDEVVLPHSDATVVDWRKGQDPGLQDLQE